MSMASRLRANSEVIPRPGPLHGPSITDAFQLYRIPYSWHRNGDLTQEPMHEPRARFLGCASLKSSSQGIARAAFYEVIASGISEIALTEVKEDDDQARSSSESYTASEDETLVSLDPRTTDTGVAPSSTFGIRRKRGNKAIRRDVVFCLEPTYRVEQFCSDREYFVLPSDAIVEAMTQSEPFEVLFSFHLPTTSRSPSLHTLCSCNTHLPERTTYKTKLEEFAAVCSNSCRLTSVPNGTYPQRRLTDPGVPPALIVKSDSHIMNLRISNVSKDLYDSMKHTVASFEAMYERMVELMRLHSQQVAYQKADILLRSDIPAQQSHQDSSPGHPWNDNDLAMGKEKPDLNTELHGQEGPPDSPPPSSTASSTTNTNTPAAPSSPSQTKLGRLTTNGTMKKCLYCGSKTTPMWRRGPHGAGTLCNACGVKWKHGKILCGVSNTAEIPSSAETGPSQLPLKSERKRKRAASLAGRKEKRKAKRTLSERDDVDDPMHNPHMTTLPLQESAHERQGSSFSQSTTSVAMDHDRQAVDLGYDWSMRPLSTLFSPLTSASTSSSPPSCQHRRRHTADTSIIEKMGLSSTSFPMSAGVDAVEAAAVLTLLKRS